MAYKPLLQLHYPEAEWLLGCPTDALAYAVRNDLLTDNGKVAAAIRFLYEDPGKIAAFGDNAVHVTAAVNHLRKMGLSSYTKLAKEAGSALGQGGLNTLREEVRALDQIDTSTPAQVFKTIASWKHIRNNLGKVTNIPAGIEVAIEENSASFSKAFHTRDDITYMEMANLFRKGVVQPAIRKMREVWDGLHLDTVIPKNYLKEIQPFDSQRELEALNTAALQLGVQTAATGTRITVQNGVEKTLALAAPEIMGPQTRKALSRLAGEHVVETIGSEAGQHMLKWLASLSKLLHRGK